MAVGDVIAQIGLVGAALNYQPAAGVEVMVTTFGSNSSWVNVTNGVDVCRLIWAPMASTSYTGSTNMKLLINNTIYLQVFNPSAGNFASFSGIQIK